MSSSYIPPPFPFPERWQGMFRAKPRDHRWLMPSIHMNFNNDQSASQGTAIQALHETWTVDITGNNDDQDSESEYEYGFVLTDEWKDRLCRGNAVKKHRGSVNTRPTTQATSQRVDKSPVNKHKQKSKSSKSTATPSAMDLELQYTQAIEAERAARVQFSIDKNRASIQQLEGTLNERFNTYCSQFQPILWPQ